MSSKRGIVVYGTDVPGRLGRMLPKGRARMRELLTEQLRLVEQSGSAKHADALRQELRRYGG